MISYYIDICNITLINSVFINALRMLMNLFRHNSINTNTTKQMRSQ